MFLRTIFQVEDAPEKIFFANTCCISEKEVAVYNKEVETVVVQQQMKTSIMAFHKTETFSSRVNCKQIRIRIYLKTPHWVSSNNI